MKKKIFTMFDYFLILLVSLLILFGILFIYSSNINSNGVLVSNEHQKQIIWAVVSFVVMIVFTIMDYRRFENMSKYLYALALFLLIIVLIPKIGIKVKGTLHEQDGHNDNQHEEHYLQQEEDWAACALSEA